MTTSTTGPLIAEHISTLQGANYFSWDPVVVLRLNLAKYDEVFTNQIPGFIDRLKERVPSLVEHKCSENVRGGFFIRMEMGTLLGHVLEHTALELQALAGINVAFGKTRSTARQGVYNVVFRYEDEPVGIRAAELAFDLINTTLENTPFDVDSAVNELRELRAMQVDLLTRALIEEARKRDLPTHRFDDKRLLQIGTGLNGRPWRYFSEVHQPEDPVTRARTLLDTFFPPGRQTHAPLYAVAGAKGASVAARLLNFCLSLDERNSVQLMSNHLQQIEIAWQNTTIESVVMEVPLHTLVETGLPYTLADTGIILNAANLQPVGEDLTLQEDLAYTLAVVVEEVRKSGVAVLNADDPHVLEMAKRVYARPVFFTRDRNLRFLSEHITTGNLAIVLTDDSITLEQYRTAQLVCTLDQIPLLKDSAAIEDGTLDAVLAVAAVLAGNGWSPWAIAKALIQFPG